MKRLAGLLGVALLAGCDLNLSGIDGPCDYERDLSDVIDASFASNLRILAEEGDLVIEGRTTTDDIRVRARACTTDRRTLNEIDFALENFGSVAELTTFVPARDNARLDLVIELPDYMAVEIDDISGDIEIFRVADVRIWDTSGHIRAELIDDDVVIFEDGSGDIRAENVGGDFVVEFDSSGSIHYRNIGGRVILP